MDSISSFIPDDDAAAGWMATADDDDFVPPPIDMQRTLPQTRIGAEMPAALVQYSPPPTSVLDRAMAAFQDRDGERRVLVAIAAVTLVIGIGWLLAATVGAKATLGAAAVASL